MYPLSTLLQTTNSNKELTFSLISNICEFKFSEY